MAFFTGGAKDQMRAAQLVKRRQQEHEQIEIKKKKIEEENRMASIDEKFKAHYDAVEQMLKSDTVGLISLDEMKKKQEDIIRAREQQLAREKQAKLNEMLNNSKQGDRKDSLHQRPNKLSFEWLEEEEENNEEVNEIQEKSKSNVENKIDETKLEVDQSNDRNDADSLQEDNIISSERYQDDDDERSMSPGQITTITDEDPIVKFLNKKKRLGKNPDVDTSFLPDKEREEEERILREKLREEWVEKQQKLKSEEVDLVFSYWDGSGHRRSLRIKKRMTIQQFLLKALEVLRRENMFNELKSSTVDQLMFVKDDVILPHHYSFYDFIVTRARGRSGLLFTFTEPLKLNTIVEVSPTTATSISTDNNTNTNVSNDNSNTSQQSTHAGKICLRSWYERNKHIFPACRWEPYDPEKKFFNEPPKNRFCVK